MPDIKTSASESVEGSETDKSERPQAEVSKKESKEVIPSLKLKVAGPCKNPAGRYVGLSKGQRDQLGVELNESVELFADGKSLGSFVVGFGSKEIMKNIDQFTANLEGITDQKEITVRKISREDLQNKAQELPFESGIETKDAHLRRMQIIEKRFPEMNAGEYITVPTAIGQQLGLEGSRPGATILNISKGKLRFGQTVYDIAIVPGGTNLGMTQLLAKRLGIPVELKTVKFAIEGGMLVLA